MKKQLNRSNGFTLLEIMVVIAILSVVISMVYSFLHYFNKVLYNGSLQADAQNNMRIAARYITAELRNANSVEILSAMPETPNVQKEYFFIDGNMIKQYSFGEYIDVLNTDDGSVSDLAFDKDPDNTHILSFCIDCTYNGQSFSIDSEVTAMNMSSIDSIIGLSGGGVIAYASPLTDSERVKADKQLLTMSDDVNAFLIQESDGSLTLQPPPEAPNNITLSATGINDSTIIWSSGNTAVIKNDGTVLRPGIDAGDASVAMTATITSGSASETKLFVINVCDLDSLVAVNTSTPTASAGVPYEHTFSANGGDCAYTYSTEDDLHGLILESDGHLHGTLDEGTGSFAFALGIHDNYQPINNTIEEPIEITVGAI